MIEETGSTPSNGHASALREVRFAYDGRSVFDNLTLELPAGVTGLLGVNGAGKTTLLRILASDLAPDRGTVCVSGLEVMSRRTRSLARQRVGYLPQSASWTKTLRVGEFVEYFAWLRRVPARGRQQEVTRAMELTRTCDLRDRRLAELSGGEHQRVMLAQALVHRPSLLILDEPTAGLDPEQRLSFREVIANLRSVETSAIISTHLLEDVGGIADQVVVLRDGNIAFNGPPIDLAARAWDVSDRASAMEQGFLRTIRGEFESPR